MANLVFAVTYCHANVPYFKYYLGGDFVYVPVCNIHAIQMLSSLILVLCLADTVRPWPNG